MVLFGHCLLGRFRGSKRLYFVEGSLSLIQTTVSLGIVVVKRVQRGILHGHLAGWRGMRASGDGKMGLKGLRREK